MSQSLLQYAFHLLVATAASFGPATDAATGMVQAAPAAIVHAAIPAPTPPAARRAQRAARVSLMDPYYSFSRGQRSGTRG